MLLCRADRHLPDDERRKIALFTNVEFEGGHFAVDTDSIYKIPSMLHVRDWTILSAGNSTSTRPAADLAVWDRLFMRVTSVLPLNIALVGKYVDLDRIV